MDLKLSGKRALVTGSTAGIGEAIARRLAAEGASVAIHGRDEARGNQLVDELSRGGTRAVSSKPIGRARRLVALAEQARSTLGGVDVLVNNAAVYPQHTGSRAPLTNGRACMRSTLLPPFVLLNCSCPT